MARSVGAVLGSVLGGLRTTTLMESGSLCRRRGKENPLAHRRTLPSLWARRQPNAKESHRTFLEVVLNGQAGPKPAKSEADEVLKEVQAAQEELLQSQIAKARAAADALGDDPAFAKKVTELQSEIAALGKEGCWRQGDWEKFSGSPCGTKVALRGKRDQDTGTVAKGLGNGPSCAHPLVKPISQKRNWSCKN